MNFAGKILAQKPERLIALDEEEVAVVFSETGIRFVLGKDYQGLSVNNDNIAMQAIRSVAPMIECGAMSDAIERLMVANLARLLVEDGLMVTSGFKIDVEPGTDAYNQINERMAKLTSVPAKDRGDVIAAIATEFGVRIEPAEMDLDEDDLDMMNAMVDHAVEAVASALKLAPVPAVKLIGGVMAKAKDKDREAAIGGVHSGVEAAAAAEMKVVH